MGRCWAALGWIVSILYFIQRFVFCCLLMLCVDVPVSDVFRIGFVAKMYWDRQQCGVVLVVER